MGVVVVAVAVVVVCDEVGYELGMREEVRGKREG